MDLAKIVRKAVAVVDTVTDSFQANVLYFAWVGQDIYGKPTFASMVPHKALIDYHQKLRQVSTGKAIMTLAHLTVLDPITANGALGRQEPIDTRDIFVLPNGVSGPIVDSKGFVDAGTGNPFVQEVWLGVSPLSGIT